MVILFSRSGSTARKLLDRLSFTGQDKDHYILSNNFSKDKIDIKLLNRYDVKFLTHKDIEQELLNTNPTKILLMGYLRILSKEVCNRHEIYNIHPADIVNYPELKGKDPIERVYSEDSSCKKYKRLGVVLHRVIPEVDEGPILYFESFPRTTQEEAYLISDKIALNFWEKLLES